MQDLAYWISPRGEVMEPTMYHIGSIVKKPKKFGESDATVKASFDKYGELVSDNSEGEARNEIIMRVMQRGFIRIRKHNLRRMQKWVVELWNMNNRKAAFISNWARWMIDTKQTDDIFADVKITDLKDFRGTEKSLEHISTLFHEAFNGESGTSIVNGRAVYEVALNILGDSVYDSDLVVLGKEDDCIESLADWITYAGSISLDDLSEEAQIQNTNP